MKSSIFLIFLLSLVSCGRSIYYENENDKIVLSEVMRSVFYAPLYVAIELGFFYEEGIDIELVTSDGADRVMTSLLSGDAQIGLSGPEAAIYVYAGGREDFAVVFAGLTARDGSFLIGRNSSHTWEDLKGAHILPGRRGGMPFMVLEYVLTTKGIRDYVYFDTGIAFAAMISSFLGGNGDFVTAFEPVASTIELEGRGYVLHSIGEVAGELPYTTFYALGSFIYENEDLMQRFTYAISKGIQWVIENEAYDVANVVKPFFHDAEITILASSIERYKRIGAFASSPIISEEAFNRMQRIMENAGELPKWVDFDVIVNMSFAENIKN